MTLDTLDEGGDVVIVRHRGCDSCEGEKELKRFEEVDPTRRSHDIESNLKFKLRIVTVHVYQL